jgi:hypothetical protein
VDFCTLFDINFLPRGLVLYRSLREVAPESTMRVFCMDNETKVLLERMALPGLAVIGLEELEAHDTSLAAVKSTRSQVEYCWTATPAVCLYSLERELELELITYVDADIMFFQNPAPLFDELGDGSILITPHGTPPGGYIVQFMPFRRDEKGLTALRWWRERCLEWCYDWAEGDKFGDQAYLDDWPERFEGVRILEHVGGAVGPWNDAGSRFERREGVVTVNGRHLIFYHYATLRLYRGGLTAFPRLGVLSRHYRLTADADRLVWATPFEISERSRRLVWEPYTRRLAEALQDIRRIEPSFAAGVARLTFANLAYQTARRAMPRRLRTALSRALGGRIHSALRRPFYRPR